MGMQFILKKDFPSKVSAHKMNEMRECYQILDDVRTRALKGDERIDWVIKGWTPMYNFWLSLGLTLPNTLWILLSTDWMNK